MPRQSRDKVKLTLTINKNVLERAKEFIPNLSAFVEMKLREYVILAEAGLTSDFEWARRDLNPRPPGYEPGALTWLSYGPKLNHTVQICL